MSVSKWAYSPEKCDGQPCVGECDMCRLSEVEDDGFITREEDLIRSAKPITICPYPHCEKCENYVDEYCTIPMVITKQIYRFTADRIDALESQLIELETLVYDEILGDSGDFIPDEE